VQTRRVLALLGLGLCWLAPAAAQQATERYVPIGRSPGVSGVSTLMGTVQAVDVGAGTLTLQVAAGSRRVTVSDATRIWLDRSGVGETSQIARLADCHPGADVEVKLAADGHSADWIKIRAQ
jgi:hypothetical protein